MADGAGAPGTPVGEDATWTPWTPNEVAQRLEGVAPRWYVVAGWALDLFRGEQTRDHEDIEIGVPSGEFDVVRAALAGFELHVVGDGMRYGLDEASLTAHFQTWVLDPATGAYVLDVFRDPHDGDTWCCRRDLSIRRPYDTVIRRTDDGIPYLAPEIALLFKAKHLRDKDVADFEGVRPLLDADQVAWLRGALARVHPGHPWLGELDASDATTSPG